MLQRYTCSFFFGSDRYRLNQRSNTYISKSVNRYHRLTTSWMLKEAKKVLAKYPDLCIIRVETNVCSNIREHRDRRNGPGGGDADPQARFSISLGIKSPDELDMILRRLLSPQLIDKKLLYYDCILIDCMGCSDRRIP